MLLMSPGPWETQVRERRTKGIGREEEGEREKRKKRGGGGRRKKEGGKRKSTKKAVSTPVEPQRGSACWGYSWGSWFTLKPQCTLKINN